MSKVFIVDLYCNPYRCIISRNVQARTARDAAISGYKAMMEAKFGYSRPRRVLVRSAAKAASHKYYCVHTVPKTRRIKIEEYDKINRWNCAMQGFTR